MAWYSDLFAGMTGVVAMSEETAATLAEVAAALKAGSTPPKVNEAVLSAQSRGLKDIGTPDTRAMLYDHYLVKVSYAQDVMKLPIPLGSGPTVEAGEGCRVAILGGGWGYKTVEWMVVRTGLAPALPAVEESSECQLSGSVVQPWNDGVEGDMTTRKYVRQGVYTYILTRPPRPGVDELPVPSLPTLVTGSRPLKPTDFVENVAPVETSS